MSLCIQTGPLGPSPCVHALDMSIHSSHMYVKCWQTPHHESEASPALSHTSCSGEVLSLCSPLHMCPHGCAFLCCLPQCGGGLGYSFHPHIPHHSREAPSVPQQPESPRHLPAPCKVLCLHPHTFQTSTHALGVQKPAVLPHHALHVPHPHVPHMCGDTSDPPACPQLGGDSDGPRNTTAHGLGHADRGGDGHQ